MPGTSFSQEKEQWNDIRSSVSSKKADVQQSVAGEKRKTIIIKLCKPPKTQKLPQETKPGSSRDNSNEDLRGRGIKRKRSHYERTLPKIKDEIVVHQESASTSSYIQKLPVLNLEEMTSWGWGKKKTMPEACPSSSSTEQNSLPLDLGDVLSGFNKENIIPQIYDNSFEETLIESPLPDLVVPQAQDFSDSLKETPLLDLAENVVPRKSNDSSKETQSLLDLAAIPQSSFDSNDSLEKTPSLLDLEKTLVPQTHNSIDLAQFDFETMVESYSDPFENMVWDDSENFDESKTFPLRGESEDYIEDYGPKYSEDQIYTKEYGPKIMWSIVQTAFLPGNRELYYQALKKWRNHRYQS